MSAHVLISEAMVEETLKAFEGVARATYQPELHKDRAALLMGVAEADALIVRNATRVDAELIAHAPNLRVVGRLGVGLDNLDLVALAQRDIPVTWAVGMNAVSVAEFVMGAVLTFARRYSVVSAEVQAGRWNRQAGIGFELHGKRLGLVGAGDIGSRLARRAEAFGMSVTAHDPVLTGGSYAVQELGVKPASLEEVLRTADFVSLHAPLLPSTRHLIRSETLALMKEGSYLINTSRGGLVDEAALAEALEGGRLAGAALDVRAVEPPGADDPLRRLPNVILTPHVAGRTFESELRVSRHIVEDVMRVLRGEPPLTPVKRGL